MRLTMKPGVERACTGTLPQALDKSNIAAATAGSVCRPDTTSTSFISGTGLKKCMPTSRPGYCKPLAMAVTEMDEVLDASTQSAATMDSSCLKSPRFTSSFSTMASTTNRAAAAASRETMVSIRDSVCITPCAVSLPLVTSASRLVVSLVFASAAAPSRAS